MITKRDQHSMGRFDLQSLPRCGARARPGHPCGHPAMSNGKCRYHGGKSTGARTPEGKERARQAAVRHGGYTQDAKDLRRLVREIRTSSKRIVEIV
jgi:hypothetical protein